MIQTESRKKIWKKWCWVVLGATPSFGIWLKLQKNIVSKYMHDRCLYLQFLTPGIDFWGLFCARTFRLGEKPNFRRKTDFSTKSLKKKVFPNICMIGVYTCVFLSRESIFGVQSGVEPSVLAKGLIFGENLIFSLKNWK